MKIGILTFHRAENFGAVLQCYALQTYLESLGFVVKIIDYRCEAIERTYYLFNFKLLFHRLNIFASVYNYLQILHHWKDRLEKKKSYKLFRKKYLNLSSPLFKITKDLGFDIYITGSDQVWNTSLLRGYNNVYFLDFPISKHAKRVAYAVSSEHSAINDLGIFESNLKNALNRFDAISTREEFFSEILKKFTSKEIDVCVDPTFLLSKKVYAELAVKPKESNYVLVYHMAEIPEGSLLAEKIARDKGCSVIEIHARFASRKDKKKHKQNVGPLELLGYIMYANLVITTSFHGLAFSLIMEKNFYIISKSDNLRLKGLLNRIGLENRMVTSDKELNINDIDYSLITEKLQSFSKSSKEFLIKSIVK